MWSAGTRHWRKLPAISYTLYRNRLIFIKDAIDVKMIRQLSVGGCSLSIHRQPHHSPILIQQPVCQQQYYSDYLILSNIDNTLHQARSFSTIRQRSNSTTNVQESAERTGGSSSKALFKSTPVNPSILSYIESIGVGIPKRKRRKRRRSSLGRKRNSPSNNKSEQDFFERQAAFHANNKKREKQTQYKSSSSTLAPPPPFACHQTSSESETVDGYRVRRLPVKVLGTASSMKNAFPKSSKGLAEVALAGRSNVGKSTLLNALLYGSQPTSRGKLPKGIKATMSAKPGETQAITLYQLSSRLSKKYFPTGQHTTLVSMILVDLPGYGFSYTSPEKAQAWQELMQHYLTSRGRSSLKRILLLIDSRHGMKPADYDFLQQLEAAMYENINNDGTNPSQKAKTLPPIQLVLTKCDLVEREDLARRVVLVKEQLSSALRRETSALPVMLTSARDAGFATSSQKGNNSGGGLLELQRELAALVPKPKPKQKQQTKKKKKHGKG